MNTEKLKKKIGQLMVFGFNGKQITPEIRSMIHEYHLGNIILFGRNIGSPEEVLALTSSLQEEAKKSGQKQPLLICTDQENGAVRRLGEGCTVFPGAMLLGAADDAQAAKAIGQATGTELKALGINWNLSPILDVNNNPDNPVIGVRSFGENPDKVAKLGLQLMKGLEDAGVANTLKHFPGHGDTETDSHLDLPVISHKIERLEKIELVPFKECIDAGADTVMTAHVYFPEIEPEEGRPATLSKKVITGLLREQLEFKGVVTTDCMEMNAISQGIGTGRGAVEALKAGVDLIMISHSVKPQREALEEIAAAVKNGELDEKWIDKAINRVSKLKRKIADFEQLNTFPSEVPGIVGSQEHKLLAENTFRKGVTIVCNDGILPLSNKGKVLLVYPENTSTMAVEDKRYSTITLAESLKNIHPEAEVMIVGNNPEENEIKQAAQKSGGVDAVIVATLSAGRESRQIQLVEAISSQNPNVIAIAVRSPYDLAWLPKVRAAICTYEFTTPALDMAIKAIYGKEQVAGVLPVSIPGLKAAAGKGGDVH